MDIASEIASHLAPKRRVMCKPIKHHISDDETYLLKVHNGVSMLDGSDNEIAFFDTVIPALDAFCQTKYRKYITVWVDEKKIRTFEVTNERALEKQEEYNKLVALFMSLH